MPQTQHIGSRHALDGIHVLDVTGTVATAYCGKLFADHGARVVNVERVEGHPVRGAPPLRERVERVEASGLAAWLAVNKQSLVLDADASGSAKVLERLLRRADVLLCDGSLPHGSLDMVHDGNAQLVCIALSWFGANGPYAGFAGSDGVCHALTGLVRGIGLREGPPLLPSGFQAQVIGGLTAYIAAAGALIGRELGNGALETIDVSIHEANICFVETGTVAAYHTPPPPGWPSRLGVNRYPPTSPMGIYRCIDGWVGVTALTPSQWQSFATLIGMPELAAEPRYAATPGRFAEADHLDTLIAPRLATRTAQQWFEEGQRMRIPMALVPTMEQLLNIDQYVGRNAFVPVTHPDHGTFLAPNTPFRLFATPPVASGTTPRLGADTDAVLREWLAFDDNEIARLRDERVVK